MKAKWFSLTIVVAMLVIAVVPMVGAAPAASYGDLNPEFAANTDNPGHPLGDAQKALKLKGFQAKMNGKTSGPVAEVAKGQFVELERQGEDTIWTVTGEFGPNNHPSEQMPQNPIALVHYDHWTAGSGYL